MLPVDLSDFSQTRILSALAQRVSSITMTWFINYDQEQEQRCNYNHASAAKVMPFRLYYHL